MPARYHLDQLPAPAGTDVHLSELPPRRMAVIRFSGRVTDELIAGKESELRAWLAAKGLTARAAPLYAYYNDPFTPGFLRRNEVLIDLTDAPAAGSAP
jgi:DNA gyrase inhibitor GyrI